MWRLSVTAVCVFVCLLVRCRSIEADTDDLTIIKTGMIQILQKLANIEKRMIKLEEIPREVGDMKLLLTSLVKTNRVHPKKRTFGPSVTKKPNIVGANPDTSARSKSRTSRPLNKAPVHVVPKSNRNSTGKKTYQQKSVAEDYKNTISKGSLPQKPKGPRIIQGPTKLEGKPNSKGLLEPSCLVLSSSKRFFHFNSLKKTWKEVPTTHHPESLHYDYVNQRLYWSRRKPATVGLLAGKHWKEQVLFKANDSELEAFTVDQQSGVGFLILEEGMQTSLSTLNKDGVIASSEILKLPLLFGDVSQMAVNETSKTLYMSLGSRIRKNKRHIIAYTYGEKKRMIMMGRVPAERRNSFIDSYTSSMIYCKGLKWGQMKLKRNKYHLGSKLEVACPSEIQLVTTSKQRVFVLNNDHMYIYDRHFYLQDRLPLPDMNGDEIKAAAAVPCF